jgi:branched-chain amino acid transport system substrate-binding protein
MSKWYRTSAIVVGAALGLSILAGCGTSGNGNTGGQASGLCKNIKIGTELPVSGTDAAVGLPTQYGVDLAVSQNKDLGGGCSLADPAHKNDVGTSGPDPSLGASNVQQLISDPNVVAIVGPFNSGVAKQEIGIANSEGIVLISPTNTNPGLTKQEFADANGINFQLLHPAGKPESYFRIPGTDDIQGKVDADVALGAPINAKTAFVVDDNTVYGKGLVTQFKKEFQAKGGTVVGGTSITPQQISNLNSLATTIIAKHPDAVFYGGVTSGGGGALKKDLVAQGGNMPMVGGDGIADDPAWLKTAGAQAAKDTYGTVAAPDVSSLTGSAAQDFKTAYKQMFPNADLLPYSAMAYDAAMIEITAIKNLIKDGKAVTRASVRDQVASLHYDGVTGTIYFDKNGDNAGNKVYSVYGVDSSGAWAFKQQVNG